MKWVSIPQAAFYGAHTTMAYFLNSKYNTIIVFLDIIQSPVFKTQNVSETGFCLRLLVKPTQLGGIDKS
jgi:hypothetical protein